MTDVSCSDHFGKVKNKAFNRIWQWICVWVWVGCLHPGIEHPLIYISDIQIIALYHIVMDFPSRIALPHHRLNVIEYKRWWSSTVEFNLIQPMSSHKVRFYLTPMISDGVNPAGLPWIFMHMYYSTQSANKFRSMHREIVMDQPCYA